MPYELQDAVFELVKILGPFNLGALGIVWNYYQCVTLDPGAVPVGWKPPLSEINQYRQRKADAGGAFAVASSSGRFCKPCNGFKPPRTHHCRTCKRCVLRMDHHCPWVANCVGQRNYASFMRFLFWVDVTCSAHLVLLSLRTGDYWWTRIGGSWVSGFRKADDVLIEDGNSDHQRRRRWCFWFSILFCASPHSFWWAYSACTISGVFAQIRPRWKDGRKTRLIE